MNKEIKSESKEIKSDLNLYDINKQLIEQTEKPLSQKELNKIKSNLILPYFREKIVKEGICYFMLLCHEKRDYTVFNISDWYPIIVLELLDCLKNRGQIYSIEKTKDKLALEIWIKDAQTNELSCYYLFPYDDGVIEIF
jgi:hypothetical protein